MPVEHHIRVPRTARYFVLGDPEVCEEVWFVIHGYGQAARRFIERFEGLPEVAAGSRCVVGPEALSRFYVEREIGPHGPESRVGASWMTRAAREHEVHDYVGYLDRVAAAVLGSGGGAVTPEAPAAEPVGGSGRRLVVLGFSQGCETASRWVTYGRIRPDELVLWGGGLATDLDRNPAVAALGRLRLRLVVGDEDGWGGRRSAETDRWLDAQGLAAERLGYAGGHRVDPDVLRRHWG